MILQVLADTPTDRAMRYIILIRFHLFYTALDVTDERIYFYNNNDNAVESVTFAGEGFTKVVTQGKIYLLLFTCLLYVYAYVRSGFPFRSVVVVWHT